MYFANTAKESKYFSMHLYSVILDRLYLCLLNCVCRLPKYPGAPADRLQQLHDSHGQRQQGVDCVPGLRGHSYCSPGIWSATGKMFYISTLYLYAMTNEQGWLC